MKTAEHIIETVDKLVRKYHTRDPYELCQLLGIKIHYYDLQKKLKGFFYYQSRQKNIVIDHNVNGILERILVAHKLGHAVLHTKIAMMHGFQEMEVFDDKSIEENEANFFAAELLLEDEEVLECLSEHTFFETANIARQIQFLLDTAPCIENGDFEENLKAMNTAVMNINSLLRRRIELKKK